MDGTSGTAKSCIQQPNIAVITIHGVADQAAGDMVCAVAAQLAAGGTLAAGYRSGIYDSVMLPVYPLCPMVQADDSVDAASQKRRAMAGAKDKSIGKARMQAADSDFHRAEWHIPVADSVAPAPTAPPALPTSADLGVAFSDYLMYKAYRNGAGNDTYETRRIRMQRTVEDASFQNVDLHEMYWADLSRLSGKVPQIVAEAFTMLFRFSQLGRTTVDHGAQACSGRHSTLWRWLYVLQRGLDWALAFLLANICLNLLLIVLTIGVLGIALRYDIVLSQVLATAIPLLGFAWLCYRYIFTFPMRLAILATAGLAAYAAYRLPPHMLIGITWITLLLLMCAWGYHIAEERYPLARTIGLAFAGCTFAGLLMHVFFNMIRVPGFVGFQYWLSGSLRILEYLLFLSIIWWAVIPFVMLGWYALGSWLIWKDRTARNSITTGRLGILVSISSYVVIWMALWALLSAFAVEEAKEHHYSPIIFAQADELSASYFLDKRYVKSTMTFVVAAALPAALLLHMLLTVLPSIFAEFNKKIGTAKTLGRWLSGGYRRLPQLISSLTITGAAAAALVGIVMLLPHISRFDLEKFLPLGSIKDAVTVASASTLRYIFAGAAGAAATFSLLGRILSRYIPALRVPLDVALDVDNHFREFPRKAIPRARIFSRYVALLEHIVAQKYDRIVIVAHSQGTVITADLLRYLQWRAQSKNSLSTDDRIAQLWARLEGKIELLTVGCPLRQLYAVRFPDLYNWVRRSRNGRRGPLATDVGVNRWINAYATGDYVGRWLWSDHTMSSTYANAPTSVSSAIAYFQSGEREVSLGAGAHTHYFDVDNQHVGRLIDALVSWSALDALAQPAPVL